MSAPGDIYLVVTTWREKTGTGRTVWRAQAVASWSERGTNWMLGQGRGRLERTAVQHASARAFAALRKRGSR